MRRIEGTRCSRIARRVGGRPDAGCKTGRPEPWGYAWRLCNAVDRGYEVLPHRAEGGWAARRGLQDEATGAVGVWVEAV
jgi:hypothetical protein